MLYVLTRSGHADEPRIREIHTPEEVVYPEHADGLWTARVKTGSASAALQGRRYGFALVEEVVDPSELPQPPSDDPPPATPLSPAAWKRAGLVIHDGEPGTHASGPLTDWRRWQKVRRGPTRPVPYDGLFPRLRARVGLDLLRTAAEVARAGAWLSSQGEEVAVVLTLHGWGDRERAAVQRALDAASALGPRSRVVAIQNDEAVHDAFGAWAPRGRSEHYVPRCARNDGFAAACNVGALHAGKPRWLLFTQADATWTADAVRDAIGLSLALEAEPTGFGAPAVVGPSGGYVDDPYDGGLREHGRNEGVRCVERGPATVDWIAGYWLLVDAAAFRRVKGWCERYFLYYEDPDLSLRLALAGCRPFVWPDLAVEHERSGTVRSRLTEADVSEMQAESRRTFGIRWGGR